MVVVVVVVAAGWGGGRMHSKTNNTPNTVAPVSLDNDAAKTHSMDNNNQSTEAHEEEDVEDQPLRTYVNRDKIMKKAAMMSARLTNLVRQRRHKGRHKERHKGRHNMKGWVRTLGHSTGHFQFGSSVLTTYPATAST